MINVIGGNIAGNYSAYLLAKEGQEIEVYEEHAKIGKPVQCTGLVTDYLDKLTTIKKEFLVNKFNLCRVHAPNGEYVDIKLRNNYLVDRHKFDAYWAEKAVDEGAIYNLGTRFLSCLPGKKIKLKFRKDGETFEKETDYLVGADGPNSTVGRSSGLIKNRKYMVALQARISIETDPSLFQVWLGYGNFGWVVPEDNEIARVGIVASKNPNEHFRRFLDEIIGNKKIREYQSGVIPVYDKNLETHKDNIFLIGDAAGMAKASTHGGILYSMLAAHELKDTILKGGDYNKKWRAKIGKELDVNFKIWRILDKFKERDYNQLVKDFSSDRVKSIVEQGNRDFPSQFVFKLLLNKPSLIKYALKLV
ncbi:MAG: NAD(P)/FAD-dependent oxidoreductase [Candidatus Woesearchaeota archaeon]|nr:MAG: NAD(P)/FAD-dependent oxidoreductase [Candidatus Woesearchaeota archaeon]